MPLIESADEPPPPLAPAVSFATAAIDTVTDAALEAEAALLVDLAAAVGSGDAGELAAAVEADTELATDPPTASPLKRPLPPPAASSPRHLVARAVPRPMPSAFSLPAAPSKPCRTRRWASPTPSDEEHEQSAVPWSFLLGAAARSLTPPSLLPPPPTVDDLLQPPPSLDDLSGLGVSRPPFPRLRCRFWHLPRA